ncbi:MAG TPA: LysE family translocator [Ktedonobacteraceae bacterium]|nr:LysE family translocator [Ktedonobacteraceae bacterium]
MDLSFYLRGLILGLSIASVVGPMSVLCMQRTITRGLRYGLVSGLGIATADGVYGSIAAFGLTLITTFLVSQQVWIRLIGGIFLVYLGIRTVLTKPAEPAERIGRASSATQTNNFLGAYASTFLLTLANPLTILSFAAVFAGLGVGGTGHRTITAALVVLGVFSGSTLWWCFLTGSLSLLRRKFTPTWLLWINRISGGVITIFGLLALMSLVKGG